MVYRELLVSSKLRWFHSTIYSYCVMLLPTLDRYILFLIFRIKISCYIWYLTNIKFHWLLIHIIRLSILCIISSSIIIITTNRWNINNHSVYFAGLNINQIQSKICSRFIDYNRIKKKRIFIFSTFIFFYYQITYCTCTYMYIDTKIYVEQELDLLLSNNYKIDFQYMVNKHLFKKNFFINYF